MSKGRKWRDRKGQRGGEKFSPPFALFAHFQLADLRELKVSHPLRPLVQQAFEKETKLHSHSIGLYRMMPKNIIEIQVVITRGKGNLKMIQQDSKHKSFQYHKYREYGLSKQP